MVFLFLRWDVLVPWRVNGTKILEGIKQAATDMVISRQNRGVEVARGATSKTQIEKNQSDSWLFRVYMGWNTTQLYRDYTGSTIRTLLNGKINPKDWQVASPLVMYGFSYFLGLSQAIMANPVISHEIRNTNDLKFRENKHKLETWQDNWFRGSLWAFCLV